MANQSAGRKNGGGGSLTDNGIQFTNRQRDRFALPHIFDRVCQENGIEHRLTQVKHPWTNGQVERMNRTIKEATVQRFHYDDHAQLQRHLADFIDAYNFGQRLKALRGRTPYEFICKCWTSEVERFRLNPIHQMPGLNTYRRAVSFIKARQAKWTESSDHPQRGIRVRVKNAS